MEHFNIVQWVDFSRGLSEPTDRASMEDHLSSGCHKCGRLAQGLLKLKEVAGSEARYQVPNHAVHYAKAIHSLRRPEKVQILPHILTRLIYDSFREPLPVGIRSQRSILRHTRYEAGDYCLELRQEHERDGSQVTLIGQIANLKEPARLLPDVSVVLSSRKKIVARAASNQFGEFLMSYAPEAHLRLYVQLTTATGC